MTSQTARVARVVITRSREGNRELARRLKQVGVSPVPVDTLSFAPPDDWRVVDRLLGNLATFDWLVFTSATGVKYFGARMNELTWRLAWKGKPKVAAVGPQTAAGLLKLGKEADFVPSSYTTSVLGEELPADPGARILLLRADIADRRLVKKLVERGLKVEDAAIYRTLRGGGPGPDISGADLIVFASPSAVEGLCELVPKDQLGTLKKLKAVCIGPVTESAARTKGFTDTTIPDSYTLNGVVREVTRLIHSHG